MHGVRRGHNLRTYMSRYGLSSLLNKLEIKMDWICERCDIPKKCIVFGMDKEGVPPDNCTFKDGEGDSKWEEFTEQQKETISCFDCKYFEMCYVFKAINSSVRLDINNPGYSKNHNKFYRTVAEVCEKYEKKKAPS